MNDLSEHLWHRFRRSRRGRLFAAAVIAGSIGAGAAVDIVPTRQGILLSALGSALAGLLAVGILEWRDYHRSHDRDWQERITRTAAIFHNLRPDMPVEVVCSAAETFEEKRFTPVVWIGMAIGGFSLFCGAIMLVIRIIEFLKAL